MNKRISTKYSFLGLLFVTVTVVLSASASENSRAIATKGYAKKNRPVLHPMDLDTPNLAGSERLKLKRITENLSQEPVRKRQRVNRDEIVDENQLAEMYREKREQIQICEDCPFVEISYEQQKQEEKEERRFLKRKREVERIERANNLRIEEANKQKRLNEVVETSRTVNKHNYTVGVKNLAEQRKKAQQQPPKLNSDYAKISFYNRPFFNPRSDLATTQLGRLAFYISEENFQAADTELSSLEKMSGNVPAVQALLEVKNKHGKNPRDIRAMLHSQSLGVAFPMHNLDKMALFVAKKYENENYRLEFSRSPSK